MLTCNRNNRESEGKYIAACLEEIKQELRQVCTYIYYGNYCFQCWGSGSVCFWASRIRIDPDPYPDPSLFSTEGVERTEIACKIKFYTKF
jgi:hypothetical protein